MKRLCDVIASAILIVISSPLLLLLAIGVYLDTGSPILYAHRRVGKNGKMFRCLKFKSMRNFVLLPENMTEEYRKAWKLNKDPRVTRFGTFIRRASLDELPQLFNVLRGEMSLVGPRPITHLEAERYGQRYKEVSRSLPGITGLWQVCGRHQLTFKERVILDYIYAKHGGILLDLGILLQTIRILFKFDNT
jgi:exopolysaccharide production protein ExoY